MTPAAAISACGPADAGEVTALWHAAGLTRPWNDPAKDFARAIRGPHSAVLAARLSGRVAATVMVGEDGHRGWVYYLGVRPDLRGQGLGRRMMEEAEAWLRGRGIGRLNLMVRGSSAGTRAFYERLGYGVSDVICMKRKLDEP